LLALVVSRALQDHGIFVSVLWQGGPLGFSERSAMSASSHWRTLESGSGMSALPP